MHNGRDKRRMSEVRASIVAKKVVKTAGAKGGRKKNAYNT